MKIGDYVEVQSDKGRIIGILISDEGNTFTVSINGKNVQGIPKEKCALFVKVPK